ncbi:hypothetical protein [Mesorhizobium australicum]|uniref:Polymer-forming protein n=1 Tax=Mesorhizobium australicum TaxID=536018 RepID=A0A1X7NGK9_9HYPH|nr:hypothetical protein [Mesorhizobium australicum]SMH36058.1 hypothetical protein SAMN02982922_1682 [Mesorhizobium australicum]
MDYHDKITGPFEVKEVATVYGMITDMAVVHRGGRLDLHGLIAGELVVEAGGVAFIHGMVSGLMRNEGQAVVLGMVDHIVTGPSGNTDIRAGALVKSHQRLDDLA